MKGILNNDMFGVERVWWQDDKEMGYKISIDNETIQFEKFAVAYIGISASTYPFGIAAKQSERVVKLSFNPVSAISFNLMSTNNPKIDVDYEYRESLIDFERFLSFLKARVKEQKFEKIYRQTHKVKPNQK